VRVDTLAWGKYLYTIHVKKAGRSWEWDVNRWPNGVGAVNHVTHIADGTATTKKAALTAAYKARKRRLGDQRAD
jgi:hypothetical protein